MKKGSVIVDVAIDPCRYCETRKVTVHEQLTYVIEDIIYYCVGNIPGAFSYTSTIALTNETIKYVLLIANDGLEKACNLYYMIRSGLNIYNNKY